ncbi:MAG: ornithine cyclodeaminase family protein, partial [Xanthobacteraceae bacterium]
MLFIHNDVVEEVLTMKDCIEVQERAFLQIPTGGAVQRPRTDMYVPCERDDGYYRWGTMEGANEGILAIRMKSDVMVWPTDAAGEWRESKYCIRPGTFFGLILLMSTRNGEPLALINDGVLQHMRVGGGAGIGARSLSRQNASTVGVLGSGGMARSFLEAFCAIRPIQRANVFSPTSINRNRYADEMSRKLSIEVVPVASAREAIRGVDILATCTDSMSPTFEADWLEPGMHVTMLSNPEVSQEVLDRCDIKIRQGIRSRASTSDSIIAEPRQVAGTYMAGTDEERKRVPPRAMEVAVGADFPDYYDLVSGKTPGREHDGQITFYHNTGNQGVQFSAVGGLVYRRAKEAGLGREIPTEW